VGSDVGAGGSVGGASPVGGVGKPSDPNRPLPPVSGGVGVGCCTSPCGSAFSGVISYFDYIGAEIILLHITAGEP
jgi:hypothetical protein